MAYVIFDLDGTVIDSEHRKATLPDGSLDLEHWVANNTPEKIAQDSLLPLAEQMRKIYSVGHTVIICTARMFSPADMKFLLDNDLPYDVLLHREPGNMEGDDTLKVRLLEDYFQSQGFSCVEDASPMMFDDNLKVIEAMLSIGVACFDAVGFNRRLVA